MTLAALLSGFALSLAASRLHSVLGRRTGWLLALLPLGLTAFFLSLLGSVAQGGAVTASYAWVPSLSLNLTLHLDGLSLLFAVIICLLGALVLAYSSDYMAGSRQAGRFYAYMLVFMASMLGIVLAANTLLLFVFWELTTISSFLLIGFKHEQERARSGALQALLVTGGGGLALLAGLLLLAQAAGSAELPVLLERGAAVRSHPLYLPILLLVLLGAFSKSAQFPFHFWLPNAMEAPTPVSAYLHSATMVKAGIYLLARMSPVLGGSLAWEYSVTSVGAATMLLGGLLAIQQTDLKRLLAYTTISALGLLTLLLGQHTAFATTAALVYLTAHALYKGALFLVAGSLDHETGTRDVTQLGGLRRAMPLTAGAAALAALSMAGLPPMLGYIAKELLYEAGLKAQQWPYAIVAALVAANVTYVAAAGIAGLSPFTGCHQQAPASTHEAPRAMWLAPALLAMLGLTAGLLPTSLDPLIHPAVVAVSGAPPPVELALWHGLTPILLLSALTVAAGAAVYAARNALRRLSKPLAAVSVWGPDRWYQLALAAIVRLAHAVTTLLISGSLRSYVRIILVTTVGLVAYPLLIQVGLNWPDGWDELQVYELGLVGMILIAALIAVRGRSHVVAAVALGVSGYAVALLYVIFSAPDLAITQVMVDTLTVILFVLVFYRLPEFRRLTYEPARTGDAILALSIGALITFLVLAVKDIQLAQPISEYYLENSVPEAHGSNVVNTILVDFRALDTLGEITVLMLAGIGVYALLKLRLERSNGQ